MSRVLDAVAAEGLSMRRAALMYGVTKSTLGYRVSGGRVLCGSMCERGKYLTNEEELLTFVDNCTSAGYARTRKQIFSPSRTNVVLCECGMEVHVSDGWWASFLC